MTRVHSYKKTISEIKFHAEECGSSCSGDNMRGMDLIDIVSVADVVNISLQLDAVADFILGHCVEDYVAWHLLDQTRCRIERHGGTGGAAVDEVAPRTHFKSS